MAFVNEPENERTIDYKRDAVFKLGGTLGLPPARMPPHKYFTLHWSGAYITIMSYTKLENVSERGGSLSHFIEKCSYPEELRPYRSEIQEMLIEALEVFGVHYGTAPNQVVTVSVKVCSGIGNLNPKFNFETQKFED